MADHRFFVYGTLAPGCPNEHILEPLGGTWQPGSVQGRLEEKGWGATVGYPGIIVGNDSGNYVDGWLLTSDALKEHWGELDEFEGQEYQRILVPVHLEDGSVVEAWIYALTE